MESSRLTVRLQPGFDWAVAVPQPVVAVFNSTLVALGVFLTPAAVLTGTLAAWRLGVDLGWAKSFFIAEGLWSHWQVWLALTIVLQLAAFRLKRLGQGTQQTAAGQHSVIG
jgi:hypothetical protein